LLVAAGLGPPVEHALISLLALNGLRVSEATSADIEHLGLERGHRTLTITRKGGKVVTIPLAPRTARAIDLAVGERTGGPVFLTADGRRLDRHGAGRSRRCQPPLRGDAPQSQREREPPICTPEEVSWLRAARARERPFCALTALCAHAQCPAGGSLVVSCAGYR
jgi:hypothetical protein